MYTNPITLPCSLARTGKNHWGSPAKHHHLNGGNFCMSKFQPVAMLVTEQRKHDDKMTKRGEGSENSEWKPDNSW